MKDSHESLNRGRLVSMKIVFSLTVFSSRGAIRLIRIDESLKRVT